MKYFFVDYENVKLRGLNGIAKLSNIDCVRIYYSEDAETMTFGLNRRINESKAKFEYIKVKDRIKNAVDCKIIFDLRDYIKRDKASEYYIVANDRDYDGVVSEFKNKGVRICKISEICNHHCGNSNNIATKKKSTANTLSKQSNNKKIEKNNREQIVRSYFGRNLSKYAENKEWIIRVVLKSKSRQEINNELQKYYCNDSVKDILEKLKPLIKDLPGR